MTPPVQGSSVGQQAQAIQAKYPAQVQPLEQRQKFIYGSPTPWTCGRC